MRLVIRLPKRLRDLVVCGVMGRLRHDARSLAVVVLASL
jgi:hypothetical protein